MENGLLKIVCQKWHNTFNSSGKFELVNVYDQLKGIEYKNEIEAFRQMSFSNKKAKQAYKAKTFPGLTISGIFSTRHDDKLVEHTGLLVIDIDEVQDILKLRRKVSEFPFVFYCGLSCSGNGLFAVCRIPKCTASEHKLRYQALQEYFVNEIGVEAGVDRSCKNISRLRYVSYDENGYFNLSAEVIDLLPESPRVPFRSYNEDYLIHNQDPIETKVIRLLSEISQNSLDIADDYNNYLALAFCFAGTFGERGRPYFHLAVRWSLKYDESAADKKFDEIIRTAKSENIACFLSLCKKNGLDIKHHSGESHSALIRFKSSQQMTPSISLGTEPKKSSPTISVKSSHQNQVVLRPCIKLSDRNERRRSISIKF